MPESSNGDQPAPNTKKRRRGKVSSTDDDSQLSESAMDQDVKSPKRTRKLEFDSDDKRSGEPSDAGSVSTDSANKPRTEKIRQFLNDALAELRTSSISSERRQFILETISSEKFLQKYKDRYLLFKKIVQEEVDQFLLHLNPIPECVSKFFQKVFASLQLTKFSKTRALDLLFQQINECLSVGNDQHAALAKTLSSNEASIISHGAYLVFMIRLASLRQLEQNQFDAFDTLCYLIEILRQCISRDIASAISLAANEEQFTGDVKATQTAQVQLALSMSKYGISLPKST